MQIRFAEDPSAQRVSQWRVVWRKGKGGAERGQSDTQRDTDQDFAISHSVWGEEGYMDMMIGGDHGL